ncbi:MAG: hypothetical protein II937_17120 [Bacteroidales bacterium]|nr:hypothetical protein [Bacteroidales bacterium]
MTTQTSRPPLKQRSPWLWGCQTVFLAFVALCVLIIIINILSKKFDGFRIYHGEIEIEPYSRSNGEVYGGYCYARCYREAIDTEKHNLKKILAFFQDTSTLKYKLDNRIDLHKHKMDFHSDGGQLYFDDFECYRVWYIKTDPKYFGCFRTWVHNFNAPIPKYTKHLDDTLMTISFQYTKFDVYTWQKFIDIVDRESTLKTPDRVYKLKNPQTDSIECIIKTKRFPEGIGFKMEIL